MCFVIRSPAWRPTIIRSSPNSPMRGPTPDSYSEHAFPFDALPLQFQQCRRQHLRLNDDPLAVTLGGIRAPSATSESDRVTIWSIVRLAPLREKEPPMGCPTITCRA